MLTLFSFQGKQGDKSVIFTLFTKLVIQNYTTNGRIQSKFT